MIEDTFAVTSGISFARRLIQSPQKGITYNITILSNDAEFSVLAVTKGANVTAQDKRLYWKNTPANSEIHITYICDEDNAEDIYVWSSGSSTTSSGVLNTSIQIKGVIERVNIIENKTSSSIIIVDANGNGDYISLQEAIDNAGDTSNNPKTIIVLPGKYEMPRKTVPQKANNRYLSIIGTDKNNCIVYNTTANYVNMYKDDSCIQIAGNVYIANLTFLATSENYIVESDSRKKSYCLHLDMEAPENAVCEINNCVLINDHFCCLGMGLRSNYTIKIINCELDCTIDSEVDAEAPGYWSAIYCHDGNGATGTQRLILKGNIIKCNKRSILVNTPFSGTITNDFINNICVGGFYKGGGATLSNICFGNNLSTMNYTT